MATIPQAKPVRLTDEEAASQLYQIIEEHFDKLGLSEEERDRRYIAAAEHVTSRNAELAKSSA